MAIDSPKLTTIFRARPANAIRGFLRAIVLIALVSNFIPAISHAAESPAPTTYQDHLLPLLRETCFGCHNNDKTEGGLNMTSFASLMRGGGSGAVIGPGDPDGSYLYLLVTHQSEPHMPPNSAKLPDEKLAVFRKFIEGGALETSGSKPLMADKPKAKLALGSISTQAPDGPPPMPPRLPLEPVVRSARSGAATALAASPWAPLVALAGQQQVLLYHADSLELLGVLPFPEGTPHVLKFSRNGKLLLAGGGHEAKSGRVVVWDITTGERVIEVGEEFDCVLAADISPDQSLIALGGPSKVVRIFSTADGKLLHEIKKHTDWICSLEFNPDNVLLASGDRNGGLFVWEAANAQEYLSLRGHSGAITSVSWRGDGNVLASASEDNSVRLWEMENGNQIKTWNAHGGVRSVDFCRDGRLVSCGRDAKVQRWSAEGKADGDALALTDVAMRAVTTFNGERIVAGDWAGEVRVWSTTDWRHLGNLLANPPALEERLQGAIQQVAAAESKHKQLGEVAAASQVAAAAMAAQFDEAQKALQSATAAQKTIGDEVASLQSTIDKTPAEIEAVKGELSKREAVIEFLGQAAAKASEAEKKLPGSPPLSEAAAKLNAASQAITGELTALQKSAQEKSAAIAAAREQQTDAQAKLIAATAQTTAAQEKLNALAASKKAADEKAAADKQQADQAAAELTAAQSAKQRWTDENTLAKAAGR